MIGQLCMSWLLIDFLLQLFLYVLFPGTETSTFFFILECYWWGPLWAVQLHGAQQAEERVWRTGPDSARSLKETRGHPYTLCFLSWAVGGLDKDLFWRCVERNPLACPHFVCPRFSPGVQSLSIQRLSSPRDNASEATRSISPFQPCHNPHPKSRPVGAW